MKRRETSKSMGGYNTSSVFVPRHGWNWPHSAELLRSSFTIHWRVLLFRSLEETKEVWIRVFCDEHIGSTWSHQHLFVGLVRSDAPRRMALRPRRKRKRESSKRTEKKGKNWKQQKKEKNGLVVKHGTDNFSVLNILASAQIFLLYDYT